MPARHASLVLDRRAALAATGSLLLAPAAFAQSRYPERPIRVVVPNGPGSSVDTIGRVTCTEMSRLLGQPMVIDNRTGAAGAIGVEAVRTAGADAYTLLVGSSSAISVAPMLQKAVTYDGLRDFEMVSLMALLPNVLVCNPQLPVQNTQQLIEWCRSKGGNAHMASAGIGSASHLAGLAFQSAAGFKALHVPYKGGAQGVASVVSGETDWVLTPAPAAMSLVQGGRLRLLGHSMPGNTQPIGHTPALDATVPGFEFSGWIGLMAPKGTPAAAIDAIARATTAALQRPEVHKAYDTNGAVPQATGPEAFRTYLRRDIEQNRKAVLAAGLQPE
ncbi:tripartite tricarboxylate transporter substrate binding protein [Ramlibacter sp. AW1]|uniref:Tripartite tricarboxylate transporter substrate binding protein n=1 Tax=Ramlibacter aurantiacus TaxID=2801330 RepID=A0A937D7G3_9BURK|nr:tripartite tricarboxylate transporter substrate binding protein [Ramlibacter aurantiacus]MBL0421988.1 tripartite tricarboxylate transporter substrate binding protein [Ramlibacter aurantiacus]